MFVDLVFPENNEDKFIALAERLGIQGLCFCYEFTPKASYSQLQEKLRKLGEGTKIKLHFGLVAKAADSMKARQLCDLLLVKATIENRPLLEKKEIDCICELENSPKSDKMHYPNSGLNQVLAAIAVDSKMILGFSFSMILQASSLRRAALLGRMHHNIRICRKYEVKTAFASFATKPYQMRAERELMNSGIALGMHQKDAQDSVGAISKRIEENRLRKQNRFNQQLTPRSSPLQWQANNPPRQQWNRPIWQR